MIALASLLIAGLLGTPTDEIVIQRGEIEARLRVDVPDEGAAPSRALLRVEIVVRGPEELQVEGPRLEDALAAWAVTRRASSWREEDGRTIIAVSMTLEQVKPGVVDPPGIVLRAREDGSTAWHDLSWPDLLKEPREVGVEKQPEQSKSPWPAMLGMIALGIALALAAVFLVRRLVRRRPRPVPAHARALARLGQDGLSPAEGLARADQVVREYLDEWFGLNTRRQTAKEMLAGCATLPEVARDALAELASRAELVKFAGVIPGEEERARLVGLARRVIESCAALPVGQVGPVKENKKTGAGR